MKNIIFILAIFALSSCATATKEPILPDEEKKPKFIRIDESDGYEFEVWKDVDGKRYLLYNGKRMNID